MTRAAIYARVSSDRQEHEETIQSQLGELRARVQENGVVTWQEYTDEGYGRTTWYALTWTACGTWWPRRT